MAIGRVSGALVFGSVLVVPLHAWFLSQCPTVDPVPYLNINEFARASWYVQEQQVNAYQSKDQLRCVVATYDVGSSSFWESPVFFEGEVLSVYNSYDGGRPTVDANGSPINRLCASLPNSDDPSKLLVAPCFLPTLFGGRYWVMGFNTTSNGEYEWAVISGGSPCQKYSDGYTTGTGYFDSGLWIFSRTPVLSEEKLAEARQLLMDKGYTLQLLQPVRQANCSYADAYIKPNARETRTEAVFCGNGNFCNPDEQCTSQEPNAGRMYGCAPAKNSLCGDIRFSCEPEDTTCNCSAITAVKTMSTDAQSQLMAVVAGTSTLCSNLKVPAMCKCFDLANLESKLDCGPLNVGDYFDDIHVEVDIQPCGDAQVSLVVKGAKLGINVPVGPITRGHVTVPIPGLSINIGIASVGLSVDISVSGNANKLDIKVGLTGCARLKWVGKVCGDKIPGLGNALPYKIVEESVDISSVCPN